MLVNHIPMDLLNEQTPMRRMHQRILCQEPANVLVSNGRQYGPYPAIVSDLSEGGARLLVKGEQELTIPVGNFNLSMSVTGGPLSGVSWKGKGIHLNSDNQNLSMGMQFHPLSSDEQRLLVQYLSKHSAE